MLAISALAGAIAHFCISLNDSWEDSIILSRGLRAQGTVLEKYDGIYDSSDEIKYSFITHDGRLITNRHAADNFYDKVQKGSLIEIAYDSANPTKNFPVDQGVRPLWHIILFTIILVIIGILLLYSWSKKSLKSKR